MKMTSFFLRVVLVSCSLGAPLAFAFTVGVTAGPHAMIMEQVKLHAAKEGLDIRIVEFNDFILPNESLNEGDIDANCYQHHLFLGEQIKSRGYKLISVGKSVLLPMGIYSASLEAIAEVKEGARVAIPNDPTNGARALKLLEANGILTLKPGIESPSILDVAENTKKLKLIEIEAPQLPRILPDVDIAVINMDWMLLAGKDPGGALATEEKDDMYANIIVVRAGKQTSKDVQRFVALYQSKEIRDYIAREFKGAVIPAW